MWNHDARARLQSLAAPDRADLAAAWAAPSGTDVEPVLDWLKAQYFEAREARHAELRDRTPGFEPTQAQRRAFHMMSWKQLAALDAELIQIGSHSIDHPILSMLEAAALEEQIRGSRRMLEDRLDRTVEHFCYPNGATNADVVTCVRLVSMAS